MILNDDKLQDEFTLLSEAVNNKYIMLLIENMLNSSAEAPVESPIESLLDVTEDIHPSQGGDER